MRIISGANPPVDGPCVNRWVEWRVAGKDAVSCTHRCGGDRSCARKEIAHKELSLADCLLRIRPG